MNCWNTLRADESHNVAGNGKRDGLKISRIGQSAAKGLGSLEPFDVIPNALYFDDVFSRHSSASTGHNFVTFDNGLRLQFLSMQERNDVEKELICEHVVVSNPVSDLAGFKNTLLDMSFGVMGDEFNRASFAHHHFDNGSKLDPKWGPVFSRNFGDMDTSFAINYSGDVSSSGLVHSASRSTFNDYGESQYAQAGGSMGRPHHTNDRVGEIVFSARKRAAAHKGRFRTCAPKRKYKSYTNDDYMGIAWPTTLRRLKNDLESIHQYTVPGIQLIFNAEIGRYENVRYVEQTNIPKGVSTDGLTGTAWTAGLSDWIFFMGEDTVAEGVAVPEEMRAKIPTDYGRSKGVAWYYLGGFGLVQTLATEARVVMWDSAA